MENVFLSEEIERVTYNFKMPVKVIVRTYDNTVKVFRGVETFEIRKDMYILTSINKRKIDLIGKRDVEVIHIRENI